jgi:hypothetical protein
MLPDPLLRWDGLHLVVDLRTVEVHLDRLLRRTGKVSRVNLEGRDDTLRVLATLSWKGMSSRVSVDLSEIRLRQRYFGFRMRRVTVLGGLRVPRRAIEAAIHDVDPERVTVFGGEGIVVIDLRDTLPPGLDLKILTVQATDRSLHLWFGAGSLVDLPAHPPPALAPGSGP